MRFLLPLACASALPFTALGQEAPRGLWSGEGAFSAGATTGNTETTDIGLSLDLERTGRVWSLGLEGSSDYGESDGEKNKSRIFLGANLDRQLSDRLFSYGAVSYEADEFSGFSSRSFVGVGLGYDIFDGEDVKWSVRGGPGWRFDELEAETDDSTIPPTLISDETSEDSFSASGESAWSYQLNPYVGLSNDTTAVYADTSSQFTNVLALNARLNGKLSARMSYEARHNTEPPLGFEKTDTITRVSLVYAIGD
ncbi:MAG: DUF481 domain-containing protein [Pseudomonadota bacterium]